MNFRTFLNWLRPSPKPVAPEIVPFVPEWSDTMPTQPAALELDPIPPGWPFPTYKGVTRPVANCDWVAVQPVTPAKVRRGPRVKPQ